MNQTPSYNMCKPLTSLIKKWYQTETIYLLKTFFVTSLHILTVSQNSIAVVMTILDETISF